MYILFRDVVQVDEDGEDVEPKEQSEPELFSAPTQLERNSWLQVFLHLNCPVDEVKNTRPTQLRVVTAVDIPESEQVEEGKEGKTGGRKPLKKLKEKKKRGSVLMGDCLVTSCPKNQKKPHGGGYCATHQNLRKDQQYMQQIGEFGDEDEDDDEDEDVPPPQE